ncbi:MAG: thioredoxin family protein [Phycisphaerales bacterium]|nr:thioredoxin family protein [Phycisphaerales bacterium]
MLPLSFVVLLAAAMHVHPTDVNPEPELGQVHWSRDLEASLSRAKEEHKPVFLLFQEIPGCANCTGFGARVLGHPLLVAAIEHCCVPVAVRNNVPGSEAEILKRFQEPSWNNPVVRFLDGHGKDLIPRADGVWDANGIASRMIAALEVSKQPVPGYLAVARDESDPVTEKAVFRMHCFWQGEAVLGAMAGVVSTTSGFVDGAEVVEVTYRPAVLSRAALVAKAQAGSCTAEVGGAFRKAPAADQQHALRGTVYERLDLTPMQRMKVHSALTLGSDPSVWLTPAQMAAATAADDRAEG